MDQLLKIELLHLPEGLYCFSGFFQVAHQPAEGSGKDLPGHAKYILNSAAHALFAAGSKFLPVIVNLFTQNDKPDHRFSPLMI